MAGDALLLLLGNLSLSDAHSPPHRCAPDPPVTPAWALWLYFHSSRCFSFLEVK